MPLQATSGAASYDAFGGGVAAVPNYIEDIFSTWLYTGNGSTQTINNGIDLAGKGGLVWFKSRSTTNSHRIFDTARGIHKFLNSSDTGAQTTNTSTLTAFNSTGFDIGSSSVINTSGELMASWTFREQPKFFDVVTYTGTGSARTVAHNLGSTPGCIIVKQTSGSAQQWNVYHRSLGYTQYLYLSATNAAATYAGVWQAEPTSTVFSVGDDAGTNANGATYVAYLFAHNAGGFGLTGTDNVISCGSYVGATTPPTIDLGWEPQWILLKDASASGADARFNWTIVDNMRGLVAGRTSDQAQLFANTADAEDSGTFAQVAGITATGFVAGGQRNTTGNTYIYIAIRRGPMRTPTTGTSVFDPELTAAAAGTTVTTNFPIDLQLYRATGVLDNIYAVDRLRGVNTTAVNTVTPLLFTNTTGAEATDAVTRAWNNTGFQTPLTNGGTSSIYWNFRRAPGFFDEVCYTGTGANTTFSHNLGVVPEMMIVRSRAGNNWLVYHTATGNNAVCILNLDNGVFNSQATSWNTTTPTASVFSVGTSSGTNASGTTYVNYLFASCPGVSKVGSYTGTGTTQTINCGFTAGSRFVLIKRTDSTGDWYVWDTARGIVAGNDPYLLLNSTAAEVTNTDFVDTAATGFEISSTAPAAINANGGTFIFLAIA